MMSKIKNFKIYTSEDRVLVANSLETALEILENNGYIVEVEYENG
jgi:ribosomal protein S8